MSKHTRSMPITMKKETQRNHNTIQTIMQRKVLTQGNTLADRMMIMIRKAQAVAHLNRTKKKRKRN